MADGYVLTEYFYGVFAAFERAPQSFKESIGEMVYGMDCKSLKPENRAENEPNMPRTTMKETVIPKSGGTQTPETTPTKAK